MWYVYKLDRAEQTLRWWKLAGTFTDHAEAAAVARALRCAEVQTVRGPLYGAHYPMDGPA